MKRRLINESTEDFIRYHKDLMLAQREFLASLKTSYYNHRDRTGCRELETGKVCPTCDLFMDNLLENEHLLDDYNDMYRKAVTGNE